jgi:non-homologous end joining protein Ku
MPRSIWNGTIMLGRIPVPVKVYSATEDHTIRFHQVHAVDGERLKQRRVCAEEGREVPYDEIRTHRPKPRELDAAKAVIEELTAEWEPNHFKDRYRQRLQRVVSRKAKGETITAPDAPEQAEGPTRPDGGSRADARRADR